MEKFQALYDDYFAQYSTKPKEINLIAYGKTKGTKINFTEARKFILHNNRKQNTVAKRRNSQKRKSKQLNDDMINHPDLSALQSAITPLSTVTPIDITNPKTKPEEVKIGPLDPKDEIMYKTRKSNKYVKRKGSGTTPKALARKQFFDNPWLVNDKKTKRKRKRKRRRQMPKSPPPKSPPPPSPEMRRKATPISPIPIKPGFVQGVIAKSKSNKPLPKKKKMQKIETSKNDTKNVQDTPKKKSKKKKSKKKKKKVKWDKVKEKEVVNWINDTMKQKILNANGKEYLQSTLENGQLIARVINKIGGNIDKKIINKKPNDIKCDTRRIEEFIKTAKELGMNEEFVFTVDDLREHKNMNLVMDALLSLKELKKNNKNSKITPLSLWCTENQISKEISSALKKQKYDLGQLLNFQADDIQNVLIKQLDITQSAEKLDFMKQLVKLKELPCCEEWIILKDNIYANTKENQLFDIDNKSDVKSLIKPMLSIYSMDPSFFGNILTKYIDADWFIQHLLSCVSRLSTTNKNEMAKKLAFKFESKRYKPIPCKALYSTDPNVIHETKCSYHIMQLISNEHNNELIDTFVQSHYPEIIFHSLSVFHPLSAGNAYHGRNILDTLLAKYPFYLFEVMTENKYIQLLLKYAIFTQLHHGDLSSLILEVISFSPRLIEEGGPFANLEQCQATMALQEQVIQKLIKWEWIEYILTVCNGNRLYDSRTDDVIISNYLQFLTDLIPQCTYNPGGAQLFGFENKDNAKCVLIESLLDGLLNDKLSSFLRVLCTKAIISILDIIKLPSLIDGDENIQNEEEQMMTMQNFLHFLFEPSLETMCASIPKLCAVITNENTSLHPIKINHETIHKPFGQIRLACLEMLSITVDIFMMDAAKPLSIMKLSFWEKLFDLAFVHKQNNFFLTHFRKLLHLSMLFRRRIFKHLCLKSDFLSRCLTFYMDSAMKRVNSILTFSICSGVFT